jgi:hypothetical protein
MQPLANGPELDGGEVDNSYPKDDGTQVPFNPAADGEDGSGNMV